MNTLELERFKKIPRNDIMIYLHQNSFLGNDIKIRDIYERINKTTSIFCLIIDDLIKLNLIDCKNYSSLANDYGCYFPDSFNNIEIKLSKLGEDYVESKIFGYNLQKYSSKDKTETIRIAGLSGDISYLYNQSFEEFSKTYSYSAVYVKDAYYILTGVTHKSNNEKKVFISYSWDNDVHKNWIKDFANKINEYCIVEFDDNLKVGMSPLNYMRQNILSSDYVIIVFTPDYLTKTKTDKTSGVKYEFSIIQDDLFRKISTGKYIPILRKGNKELSIPDIMQDAIYLDFSIDSNFLNSFNDLIKKISE